MTTVFYDWSDHGFVEMKTRTLLKWATLWVGTDYQCVVRPSYLYCEFELPNTNHGQWSLPKWMEIKCCESSEWTDSSGIGSQRSRLYWRSCLGCRLVNKSVLRTLFAMLLSLLHVWHFRSVPTGGIAARFDCTGSTGIFFSQNIKRVRPQIQTK